MRKSIITGLFLMLLMPIGTMQAQYWDSQFTADLFQMDEHIKRNEKGINFEDTEAYSGTPYNHPSFLVGSVYKNNELLANDVALRYNAVADEMEIKRSLTSPAEDARVLTKSPDIFVKIMDDIFVFVPYQGGVEGGGYFEVLFEGENVDLFKKHKKDFTPAKPATTSITRPVPAKFEDEPVYYLVNKEGKFYELPGSRNRKLKVFGKNKDMVKDYVKDNNLDVNKEDDLLRLIRHYDRQSSGDLE